MILPAKLVNERLMFLIDYGDKLPWGSVITRAKITVTVSSGEDPTPQKVFSQVWDIDGTIVTYQVRKGLPGVVYDLNTAVQVSGEWLYMTVKLAVLPDSGGVGALYPLTRTFNSHPYPAYQSDNTVTSFSLLSGDLVTLLFDSRCEPDNLQQGVTPIGGSLISLYKDALAENDHIQQGLTPVGGSLLLAKKFRNVQSDAIQQGVTPVGGQLVDSPIGKQESDAIQQGVIPVGGQLY